MYVFRKQLSPFLNKVLFVVSVGAILGGFFSNLSETWSANTL